MKSLHAKYTNEYGERKDLNDKCLKQDEEINFLKEQMASMENQAQTDFDTMKANYENTIEVKDNALQSERAKIAEYDEKLCLLMTVEDNGTGISCSQLHKLNQADKLRMKPTRKSSSNVQITPCSNALCESSTNTNMIRCSCCLKFVCELCSQVQIQKLKPSMEKCNSLYFVCSKCNEGTSTNVSNEKNSISSPKKTQTNDILSEQMIDSKLSNFGAEILSSVGKMVEDKLSALGNQLQGIEKLPESINQNYINFAEALKTNATPSASVDFKKIINDTKNSELVQEKERKMRAMNVIIHGVSESDSNAKDDDDAVYIDGFLGVLGVNAKPASIVRLGKKVPNKTRPLKMKMSSEDDKTSIMSRLSNLKGADEKFCKISVTDDYTPDEREEIRRFVDDAKAANTNEGADSKYIWKVRGDPKNGLQIKKFLKKRPIS